jgi:hypothetical protein
LYAIRNLAFEAPDACASTTEIPRRGITRLANVKDVLPTSERVVGKPTEGIAAA